jgi:hypothetical protein
VEQQVDDGQRQLPPRAANNEDTNEYACITDGCSNGALYCANAKDDDEIRLDDVISQEPAVVTNQRRSIAQWLALAEAHLR